MELIYIWIEKFKNIKQQGFNFSPKHWIEFTPTENEGKIVGGKLTHEVRNPGYPDNFFGENISNITAIVGKNGSGKSNLLEFLCYELFQGAAYIKVYFDSKKLILELNQFEEKNILRKSIYPIKVANEEYFYSLEMQPFFYSSVLEFRQYKKQDIIDISKYKNIKESINVKRNDIKKKINPFSKLQCENTLEQAKFLNENQNEFKDAFPEYFYIPNTIQFTLNYEVANRKIFEKIKSFFTLNVGNTKKEALEKAIIDAKSIILTNHISEWTNIKNGEEVSDIINNMESSVNSLNLFLSAIENATYRDANKNISKTIDLLDSLLRATKRSRIYTHVTTFDLVPEQKRKELSSGELSESRTIFYQFKEAGNDEFFPFKVFLSKMLEINSDYHFFDFSWEGLSYGEDQLLSMFARLYDSEFGEQDERDIILLIDEGELGLHPDWQRRYIDVLKHFINHFGKKWSKSIQLILTSHSPFLISDLPKSNVIFLNKNENGNCIVRHPDDISQTFGANIHSLYRSSFFLENGFVGEFAKQKIDWVIGLLNKGNMQEIEEKKQEINFIIENIGEALLQKKLREMYNNNKTVEERIQVLEEEIKQLKQKKGNENDSN